MAELWEQIKLLMRDPQIMAVVKAVSILAAGLVLAALVKRWLRLRRLHAQHSMILSRIGSMLVLTVAVLWAFKELGLELSVLLGAAGILTVAVGFAAQTSASNLISGLFLMGERPFQVGDIIQVGESQGYVLSIDFLSVKIRAFDNRLIRIPNESMLKTQVTNFTRFPIRRADLKIGVAYKEDLDRVRNILYVLADREPFCLDSPKPFFLFLGYGDSALEFQFSFWLTQENFYDVRTQMWLEIKRAFDREGIEIPFPHRTLYTGSATEPMPVKLVSDEPQPEGHGKAGP